MTIGRNGLIEPDRPSSCLPARFVQAQRLIPARRTQFIDLRDAPR